MQEAPHYPKSSKSPTIPSYTRVQQGSRAWARHSPEGGPIQPKLLHNSLNKKVREHEVFQIQQSLKYSWSQPPGIPDTDTETHRVNRSQKRKTGLVRYLSWGKIIITERTKVRKRMYIPPKSSHIKKKNATPQCRCQQEEKKKPCIVAFTVKFLISLTPAVHF